jgi:hypothetical protein
MELRMYFDINMIKKPKIYFCLNNFLLNFEFYLINPNFSILIDF